MVLDTEDEYSKVVISGETSAKAELLCLLPLSCLTYLPSLFLCVYVPGKCYKLTLSKPSWAQAD